MSALPDLGPHPVICSLPELDGDDLIAVGEVLCQEGFRVWSLPADRLAELATLRPVFGRRAQIGVHGVTTPAEAAAAAESSVAFVATALLSPELVAAGADVPVILGGLTPSELRAGLAAGAAAVQLIPAEAFSSAYFRTLPGYLGGDPVIATGRLERYQAELWLQAGGLAVWPTELVSYELVSGDSLDGLRAHLQQWRLGD